MVVLVFQITLLKTPFFLKVSKVSHDMGGIDKWMPLSVKTNLFLGNGSLSQESTTR